MTPKPHISISGPIITLSFYISGAIYPVVPLLYAIKVLLGQTSGLITFDIPKSHTLTIGSSPSSFSSGEGLYIRIFDNFISA